MKIENNLIFFKNFRSSRTDVFKKKCSENIQQIYRGTPMQNCDFNKAVLQIYWIRTSRLLFSCKFAACFQNAFH